MRRKLLFIIITILCMFYLSCQNQEKINYNDILEKAVNKIELPETVTDDLQFKDQVTVDNVVITFTWSTSNEAISTTGKVERQDQDTEVVVTCVASCKEINETITKEFTVIITQKDKSDSLFELAFNSIEINNIYITCDLLSEVTVEDIKVKLSWKSSSEIITITNNKLLASALEDNQEVTLTCTANISGNEKTRDYKVIVVGLNYFYTILEQVDIPKEIINTFNLSQEIETSIGNFNIKLNPKTDLIDDKGIVNPKDEEDTIAEIEAIMEYEGVEIKKIIATSTILSCKSIIEKTSVELQIPSSTNTNISLIKNLNGVNIQWASSNEKVLSKSGVCGYVSNSVEVTLTAMMYIEKNNGETYFANQDKEYVITVTTMESAKVFELIESEITVPTKTNNNLTLPTTFKYDCIGQWSSSNDDVLSTTGVIHPQEKDETITLTLTLTRFNDIKSFDYEVIISGIGAIGDEVVFYGHNLVDRAIDYKEANLNNLVLTNGKVTLTSGALSGTYESQIFKTRNFVSIVGSYSCVTTETATCEVAFSIRVNGVWSKYISYGEWGLGKTNLYYDTKDAIASLNTDEINTVNSKNADGIKYKVTLRRDATTTASPILSLVACAIKMSDNNYNYVVDTSALPHSYDINVPKLYQHDVPGIGGSICSATTTTMLLKYKGFSFADKGYQYEHEFMAHMVADTGHNNPTYGNWSYNMITAGAYGVDAYVGRMYSFDELRYHLVNVGPVGASIKGTFGSYTTGGHLIVVRGYKIVNGQTTVICNDPNIKGTYYTVTLQTFLTCWRNVVYIVE